MKSLHSLYFSFLFLFSLLCTSQEIPIIRIAKSKTQIYFFQKGIKGDTLVAGKNNFFYLQVPDSLKSSTILVVENGRLLADKNDSLVTLNFLRGLRYESGYSIKKEDASIQKKEMVKNQDSDFQQSKQKANYEFLSLISGTAPNPSNEIVIRLVNKKENSVLLENVFYFKND